MTPCENKGYKFGDEFVIINDNDLHFPKHTLIKLHYDDGDNLPLFVDLKGNYSHVNLDNIAPWKS